MVISVIRQISISPGIIGLSLTSMLWCAILLMAPTDNHRWAVGIASLLISALYLTLLVSMPPALPQTVEYSLLAGAAILTAGVTWTILGFATGAETAASRDGAILLVLAGILSTVSWVNDEPRLGLISLFTASAAVLAGITLAPTAFSADRATWAVGSMTALMGLSMIIFPIARECAYQDARRGGPRLAARDAFGLLSGTGYLMLSFSLTSAGAASSAWWLLMISIGNAGMALSYHSRMQPRKVVQLLPRYTSLSRYSALLAIIVVATALVFRVAGLQRRDLDAAFITIGISVIFAASTALIVASSHDVNVLRTLTGMATTLLRQSRTDALTGLPNRRALDERLQAEIHRSARFNHPLSVGLIDIDDFKSINDQLGHQAGDAVLRQFSEALERELRSIDVVGRFGGEEFLMILPETASEGAWIAADRLLRSIREQSRIDGLPGRAVTASIGLASFPVDGRSAKTLLAASDRALYAAKRAGKNQIALAQRQ